MNLTRRTTACVLLATAGLVVLVGCSPGGGPDAQPTLGPVSQRLVGLDGKAGTDVTVVQQDAAERRIAACMAGKGFDYTPQTAPSTPGGTPGWDTMEFARRYGYGITTWSAIPETSTAAPDATASPGQGASDQDPAYQTALWGPVPDDGTQAWQPGGCYGQAYTEVFDDPVAQALASMQTQVDDDTRVVRAQRAWASCMAGKGYRYATSDDAMSAISDRFFTPDGQLEGAALKKLRTQEISTAVADQTCRGTAGLTQARAAALAGLEAGYYAQHRDAVDAYVARLATFFHG